MVEIKKGDKITVTKRYKHGTWTPRKHYEVLTVNPGINLSAKDDNDNELWFHAQWEGNEFNLVKKAEEATTVTEEVEKVIKEKSDKKVVEATVVSKVDDKFKVIGQDENKKVVELAIEHDLPVLLIGETGTGKTSLVREQAIIQDKELVRFSITGETTVDEFVGKYELEKGETVWKDGVLLDAMKNGKWLVADEVNVALPEILFVLHSLLDDDKQITVSNHAGEVVKPHDDFRFFATMNPPEEYAGTKELNKAFQSRFSIVLTVHYPAPDVEGQILITKAGVSDSDATRMVDVANALREAKKQDKIFYTCSTRDLLHWADVYNKGLSAAEAFKVAILNKTGSDSTAVAEVYKKIIGDYIAMDTPEVTLTIDFFKKEKERLVKDMKDFEARKTEIREEITADIVKQLTHAVPATVAAHAPKPEEITDGVFSS